MKKHDKPSDEVLAWLNDNLSYDPKQGLLYKRSGKLVDHTLIRALNERLRVKHIAWYMQTGEWPELVRSVNGNAKDCRWSNLVDTLGGARAEKPSKKKVKQVKPVDPNPLVSLTFSEGVWTLRGPGVKAEFKRFKSAVSALSDLYYTCANLEDDPM